MEENKCPFYSVCDYMQGKIGICSREEDDCEYKEPILGMDLEIVNVCKSKGLIRRLKSASKP